MLADIITQAKLKHHEHECAETLRLLNSHQIKPRVRQLRDADEIINYACLQFGVTRGNVMSQKHYPELCRVRQCLALVLHDVVGLSYRIIGELLREGHPPMDHSTVIHAREKAKGMKGRSRELTADVMAFAKELHF